MWSLDSCKIAYFKYDFYKESSKLNTSHMVPIKECLFFNVLHIFECEKWLVFVMSGHTELLPILNPLHILKHISLKLSLISIAPLYHRFSPIPKA